eukprot:1190736-Prorocentrum_minimum.AAC.5
MVIGIGMMVLQQFSGVNAVIFYGAAILRKAGVKSADVGALAIAVTQVVMTCVCCWLMDLSGRRALLMVSTAGMAASVLMLAYYFAYEEVRRSVLFYLYIYIYIYKIYLDIYIPEGVHRGHGRLRGHARLLLRLRGGPP